MCKEALPSLPKAVARGKKRLCPLVLFCVAREGGYLNWRKSVMSVLGAVSLQSSPGRHRVRKPKTMAASYRCISACSQGKLDTADFMMAL